VHRFHTGGNNQRFVYPAEGQLRPRHANTYCTDIKGGSAGNNTDIHLWDCDSGVSEKWVITALIRLHVSGSGFLRSKNPEPYFSAC
jgi:hypothetical protein